MTDTIVTANSKNYSSLNFLEAAKNGNLQAINIWVEYGEPISRELGSEALGLAAQGGHLELVKYLIKYGAHSFQEIDNALIIAAAKGHLEVVKFIVELGANVNSQNGTEALMGAIYSGYLEIVKYLIDQGANPNVNEGEPVKEAAAYGRLEILKCLVDHGADLDTWGGEAFIAASKLPTLNREVISYLLGQEIIIKGKKIFVVMDTDSTFIGAYSCRKKAHEVIDRMEGKFLNNDLIISERLLDDFSMFDPLMSDKELRESVLKHIKATLYAGGGNIKEYDRWEDAEKALLVWKKENNSGNAYIHGWHPSERDLCIMSAKDLRIVSPKNLG